MENWVVVDCEGKNTPVLWEMREFGAVNVLTDAEFHGTENSAQVFKDFEKWLINNCPGHPVFWSDNPAFDWQWINAGFWKWCGANPFGHSARRIGDLYCGVVGDVGDTSGWKKLRVTRHDHNPVNDARGNAEALREICRMMKGRGVF